MAKKLLPSARNGRHVFHNPSMNLRPLFSPVRTATLWGVALVCGAGHAWGQAPHTASHTAPAVQPSAVVTLGVQIVHDSHQEVVQWYQWLEHWRRAVPQVQWQLRPLHWEALQAAVHAGELEFVVTSPGHYVALESQYGAVRIASQMTDAPGHASTGPLQAVGSALVVPAHSALHSQKDLQGQRIAAVAVDAFGGYQVMAAQWRRHGLDPAQGKVQTLFTGYPMEQALEAVQTGQAQAAVVRVCLLEHMAALGILDLAQWRVLPSLDGHAPQAAGCQISSARYPGWALAALQHTPQSLSHQVLVALLTQLPQGDLPQWTVPADYQSVHEVLRTLEVAPYARVQPSVTEWLWQYRYWGLGGCALLLLGIAYLLHVEVLVQRRTQALTRSMQERDALAQQIAQAREKMDHMGRLSVLGELSATLAHEISHPLASLSNYISGLRRRHAQDNLPPQQLAQALDAMDEAASRTQRVLDSVRALARKRVSVQRQLALWPVVCETVELFQAISAASAQCLQVQLQCPEPLRHAQVVMDALQIQQVLLNLLKNAQDLHRAQARMHLPVVVSLAFGHAPQTVTLAVCDHGETMSEVDRAQLFEPFYTTKPDGLGLGLSISRSIAELHGGHLRAQAQQAQGGLCMELVLPLAVENSDFLASKADTPSVSSYEKHD